MIFEKEIKPKGQGVLGNMNESWNPEIPLDLQQNFKKNRHLHYI